MNFMNFMKERTVTMNRECILEQAKQHDSFYLYEDFCGSG